ncbi:transcriptional regulator [Escherichia albertii KF1]|nr:transcriptional regulator [Escherichia albertii KF1]
MSSSQESRSDFYREKNLMETVFDALKAMGKATSIELAARLDISREEVLNELWELKNAGFVDKSAYTWRVADNNVQQEQPAQAELPEETTTATVAKISECDLTATIEQRGPQTADELATLFGTTSRKVASTLAQAISKGRLIRVNQNGKFRYCMPDDNLPAEPKAAIQEEIKTETVADIVQSLPSFTKTRADDLTLPSLHLANRELRRAKNRVQKWERVCAALRELNKHRDIVRQIVDSTSRVVSEK